MRIGRNHPPDIFVTLWQRLDAAIVAGDLVSPEEVLHELERGTDDLAEILGARDGLFLPLDAAQMAALAEVMGACRGIADEEGERNRADPFVVALARVRRGTVVTGERPRRDLAAAYKIPDACTQFGIPYLDWFGFLRQAGWQL